MTVIVWRDQAEHAADPLSKGSRVVVIGRLQQRSWTAEDGSARSTVEVAAEWSQCAAPRLQRGGPGAFLVDVDALPPAAATFAIPLAVCAA